MAVKPISPFKVLDEKDKVIPDLMMEIVNELLLKNWNGGTYSMADKEIFDIWKFKSKIPLDVKWLDFESIYEKAGWKVRYEKSGFNETGPSYFHFSKK